MDEKGPENYCPLCGGSKVDGAHTKLSKTGKTSKECIWACRDCEKCWERETWQGLMDWCMDRNVSYMDQAKGQLTLGA
jgi:hypothetical protein